MATRGTALLVQAETWPEYVARVTSGVSRKDIAQAADVNVSGVSRWLTGTSRPSAEKVVTFARGLRLNPVEALVAAGYLDVAEIAGAVEVVRTRSQLSDEELLSELAVRLDRSSRSVVARDDAQEPPNWGRGFRPPPPSDSPRMSRDQ